MNYENSQRTDLLTVNIISNQGGGGIYYYVFAEDEDLYLCISNIIKLRNNKHELWHRSELEK